MAVSVSSLPTVNASLNAASAVLLSLGWLLIRAGKRQAHRRCMVAAFACSAVFLASYLWYHYHVGSVRYGGPGRPFYLALLLTHTLLAAAVPPLALRSFFLAYKGRFEEHKRAARWALPIWLYVSFTGVLVYVLLYRLAPAAVEGCVIYIVDAAGRPRQVGLDGKTRELPCDGVLSADGSRIACAGAGAEIVIRSVQGAELARVQVPAYRARPDQKPFPIRVESLRWSPDGARLLAASPYFDIHQIYSVYDLKSGAIVHQAWGDNLLGWLDDSRAYLTHDSFEGQSGRGLVVADGLNEQTVTLFRNSIDGGPPAVWGRLLWAGEPPAPGEAGTMSRVFRIQAGDRGRKIRALVSGPNGGPVEGWAPSRADQRLRELKAQADERALFPRAQGRVDWLAWLEDGGAVYAVAEDAAGSGWAVYAARDGRARLLTSGARAVRVQAP